MIEEITSTCTAFAGTRMIANGALIDVALRTKQELDAGEENSILVFDDETSNVIEIDFRGSADELKKQLLKQAQPTNRSIDGSNASNQESNSSVESNATESDASEASARGRGRPKLGVISREVTLLPRHWDWLNAQPGGASVALRKLVEEAKRASIYKDARRTAQNTTYKFMSAMAGNLPGFEEASRALFAPDAKQFAEQIESWPNDIRIHLEKLSQKVFAAPTTSHS